MPDVDASQGRHAAGAPRPPVSSRPGRFVRRGAVHLVPAEAGIPEAVGVEIAARDRLRRRILALADIAAAALSLLIAVVLMGNGDQLRLWTLAALPLIVVLN